MHDPFCFKNDNGLSSRSYRQYQLIMPKISGLGHDSILMDGVNLDGRIDLQKIRKIAKESTGGEVFDA